MFQTRHIFNKIGLMIASSLFSLPALALGEGDSKYNLPLPAATITREIYDLHMLTATVATVIMIIVTAIIVYSLIKFRKSAGYEADQEFNNSWFGRWSWVLVPAIVLGIDFSIAGPATKVLAKVETYDDADVTVKVIGSQWKWTYEYMGEHDGVKIVSNLKGASQEIGAPVEAGNLHLRDVDNRLVLPTGKRIRFLHTATDVLHAWWVPAIAYKKDSIPGYINETWTYIEKEGTYRGQCAENCGTGHAYMPIVVDVVSAEAFDEWIKGQKIEMAAAAAEAASAGDKNWNLAELMERGEKVYAANCTACHQATGTGIPNVFPGLKGSKMVKEDMAAHLDMVINGSKTNPVMAAWGKQLNDLELAAVIT